MIVGNQKGVRKVESVLKAFESCMGQIRLLDNKYNFTEEEKLTFYKFEYQLKNLSKELQKGF
ncbi:hypothetical protein OCD85_27210 [Bacillus pacificus]|uniref:hypothetical protein n=1 Tax=Bacillus cereus group TaxID=86661 RepID=UPI0021CD5AF7|nr:MULTISPECIES: hypothetical protein [Bacillus cereus group]MCU5364602.1 hypothetical protein [Bacillus pacificus]MCU5402844.1 hypothetical protein [Bacillus pacificus]MDA1963617.1 hypothetical protein [Bacillus cereus group sp. BcHK10]